MKILLIKRYRTDPNFLLLNFFAHHLKSRFSLKSLISLFDFFTVHIKSKPLSCSNQTTNPIHQSVFCLHTRETGRESDRALLFRPAIIAPIARCMVFTISCSTLIVIVITGIIAVKSPSCERNSSKHWKVLFLFLVVFVNNFSYLFVFIFGVLLFQGY